MDVFFRVKVQKNPIEGGNIYLILAPVLLPGPLPTRSPPFFSSSLKLDTIRRLMPSATWRRLSPDSSLPFVATNITTLWATWEYGKYSIRGKSELRSDLSGLKNGLDKSYITQYSYGIPETMTLLIPAFQGGASVSPLSEKSEVVNAMRANGIPESTVRGFISKPVGYSYWRNQFSTAGHHKIEFSFEPIVYSVGERISRISSLLLIALVLSMALYELRRRF